MNDPRQPDKSHSTKDDSPLDQLMEILRDGTYSNEQRLDLLLDRIEGRSQ